MELRTIETEEEIRVLEGLASKIWRTYWTQMLEKEHAEYMFEKFQSYNAIKEQLSQGYVYKILSCENENVGYYSILDAKEYLYLSKIYMDEGFRGRGYGKKMLQDIVNTSKILNLSKIRLNVNKYNTNSIKAYENWGFKIIESVVLDVGQGFVMDDYVMELDLSTSC